MINNLKLFSFLIIIILFSSCRNNDRYYETKAIEELDDLAEVIGELSSCSYTLKTLSKHINKGEESDWNENTHDVYMRGPDRFYIYTIGTKGQKSFWYNGRRFSYYLYDRNVFDTIKAEGNIVEVIDDLHEKYNIYFPAADFFYPTLTDDIIDFYDEVISLESQTINKKEYAIIQAVNKEKILTIWIDETSKLPYKFIIEPQTDQGQYYEADFSNWKLNPKLYDILFEYQPSRDSKKEPLKLKQ